MVADDDADADVVRRVQRTFSIIKFSFLLLYFCVFFFCLELHATRRTVAATAAASAAVNR